MTVNKTSENTKSVNSQITDAITQANVMNIGLAPAQSLGTLYQTTAQAVGTAIQNAVANQQNNYSLGLAATAQNLQSLLSLSSASAARGTASLQATPRYPAAAHHFHHSSPATHPVRAKSSPAAPTHAPPQTPLKP